MSSSEKKHLAEDFCEVCGNTEVPIQRHRIKPGREGGKYRVGNVIAVDPNCHSLIEHKFQYTRQQLWDIVKLRLAKWLEEERVTETVYQNAIAYIDSIYDEPYEDDPSKVEEKVDGCSEE